MYTRLGKMNSVTFGNSTIRYRVKKSPRRKTTQILVDRSGVQVISPSKMSENRIKELVRKNSKWIYKKQLWAKEESNAKLLFKDGSRVPYMGRMYLLKVKEAKTERISFSRGKFTVRVTKNTPKRVRKMFRNWLKERAYRVIEQRANHYAKKIGVKFKKINVKEHKERWGSVSKNKAVNFNLNLLCAPKKIQDYLVVHELCHLKIPNHSPKYWELVYSIMPDYEKRKDWLRINWKLINS